MPISSNSTDLVDAAVFNPASVFKAPDEILKDEKVVLSRELKIRALQTWWMDVTLRLNAGQENMPMGVETEARDSLLEEKILAALNKLGASCTPH